MRSCSTDSRRRSTFNRSRAAALSTPGSLQGSPPKHGRARLARHGNGQGNPSPRGPRLQTKRLLQDPAKFREGVLIQDVQGFYPAELFDKLYASLSAGGEAGHEVGAVAEGG